MNTSSHWRTGSKKSNIKGWSYLNDTDAVLMSVAKNKRKTGTAPENQVLQIGCWSCFGLIPSCSFMMQKNSWNGANRGGQKANSCLLERQMYFTWVHFLVFVIDLCPCLKYTSLTTISPTPQWKCCFFFHLLKWNLQHWSCFTCFTTAWELLERCWA